MKSLAHDIKKFISTLFLSIIFTFCLSNIAHAYSEGKLLELDYNNDKIEVKKIIIVFF